MLSTREKELSSLNSSMAELEGEREAKDALHAFYQGQVEAIVKDKVKELQAHVSQVEEAFRAERDEAVGEIREGSVSKVSERSSKSEKCIIRGVKLALPIQAVPSACGLG